MKLIGMLDSPFVRRTAIAMQELGLSFEHQSLSVFRDFAAFKQLNPFVKAPTLIIDQDNFLVDSNIILQYCEQLSDHSLFSHDPATYLKQQQIISIATIAYEKTVQVVYEFEVRPEDKRHLPWLERISAQLEETFALLEHSMNQHPALFDANQLNHASIATAVAWYFTQHMRPGLINPQAYPALVTWSEAAEKTPSFSQFPYDESMSNRK